MNDSRKMCPYFHGCCFKLNLLPMLSALDDCKITNLEDVIRAGAFRMSLHVKWVLEVQGYLEAFHQTDCVITLAHFGVDARVLWTAQFS